MNSWPNDTISKQAKASIQSASRNTVFSDVIVDDEYRNILTRLCQTHNWNYADKSLELNSYISHGSKLLYPSWKFSVMETFDSSACTHVISNIMIGSLKASIFTYNYYSSSDVPSIRHLVLQLDLPMQFPQILLDSLKNEGKIISSTQVAYKSNQIIQLEGMFSQEYTLYVPKGVHINALSLLAPNAMDILVDSLVAYDVEFFGNKMFIYTNKPAYEEKNILEMIRAAEAFAVYLKRLAKSWSYQQPQTGIVLLKRNLVGGLQIKVGRKRIGIGTIALLFFMLVIGYVMYSRTQNTPEKRFEKELDKQIQMYMEDQNR